MNGAVVSSAATPRALLDDAAAARARHRQRRSLRTGDLMASGTISGAERGSEGSLIELTRTAPNRSSCPDGIARTFLEDGDEVVLRGRAGRSSWEVRGRVLLPFADPAASGNVFAMAGRIVGVDGSEAGDAALRWAADIARMRDAELVVVHAWTFIPPAPLSEPGLMAVPAGDLVGDLEVERQAAEPCSTRRSSGSTSAGSTSTADWSRTRRARPSSRRRTAPTSSSSAPTATAIGAALLGSVSRHAEKHASCEVMIIRPKRDERGE